MKLLIGLGNPGKTYENTRHNVGFMMIDILRESFLFETWTDRSRFSCLISEGIHNGEKILLAKPTSFMNLSGNAVASLTNFYELDPKADILIISDDIDMEFAKVRYRKEGSHGGQNGLRDIIMKLGTDEFSRIKIGVGRHEKYSVSDWVLSKFTQEEIENLKKEVFIRVGAYIHTWLP